MPMFRETTHIFSVDKIGLEYFETSWMNYDKVVYPPTSEWDYGRELTIQDVDLWEVIMEWSDSCDTLSSAGGGGGFSGVYAAWRPHAELFMVKLPPQKGGVRTFYGRNADMECRKYLKSKNIEYYTYPEGYDAGIVIDQKGMHYKYKF